jgi:transglutaminase-like putative cysteine protease/pimeloyl-ACP methyl ester carboxylesterase
MVFKIPLHGKQLELNPVLLFRALRVFFLLAIFSGRLFADNDATNKWWSDATEQALTQAGTNRTELVTALEKVPATKRAEIQFLIENAPAPDLQTLSAAFLLNNITLADEAFAAASWHDQVPPDIFLNDILPYACVNETRDGWRPMLQKICAPLVVDSKTPGEAAQKINENIFKIVNVRYSTARTKADQSPSESMVNGLASCTGLSILLVDACRSIGVPARLAGTPMWTDMSGNHSWVEVWDNGWHFVGASEPDPKGLDHAWFQQKASQAVADVPLHAIYAASFKKTVLAFPLDWAPDIHWVNAVNVTARYASKTIPVASEKVRLLVKVIESGNGHRLAADVTVDNITNSAVHFAGESKDESADMNNVLSFEVPAHGVYQICAELGSQTAEQIFIPKNTAQQLVVLSLTKFKPLAPRDEKKLKTALSKFFTASAAKQADWKFSGYLEKLLRENEPAVRQAAWEVFKAAPIHGALEKDFAIKQATFENYTSAYTVKYVGERPTNGWALFIAMHGGGGAPKAVNDEQWGEMQRYYKDHPEAGGYIYVAPRAPNDTWNGFYDVYVYPLMANLVHQFLLFGDVNPDKVFIMGYSHGGYGAFAIGPKEPDLFAAIHASAAAPTDGETTGVTLRNTIFTCMVGGLDTMYGRRPRDEKFRAEINQLRGDRTDIYPVTVTIVEGNGHTGLPDRDLIKDMYPAIRNPVPRELTWLMTDTVITDFFWLQTDTPDKQKEIDATCRDNQITVTTTNVTAATVLLDSRLVDFKKPVTFDVNGKISTQKIQPSLRTLCETMQHRCDPGLAFTAELPLPLPKTSP